MNAFKHFKTLAICSAAALLLACGGSGSSAPSTGGSGGGTTLPALTVSVTGAGAAAADGSYTVNTNSAVTLTCSQACTFTNSSSNAAVINTSSSSTVFTGTAIGSNVIGTITVTASAAGTSNGSVATIIKTAAIPLAKVTNAEITQMFYSNITASNVDDFLDNLTFIGADALMQLRAGSGNAQPMPSTSQIAGISVFFRNTCFTGSYSASWSVANNLGVPPTVSGSNLAAGDFLTLNFNNCKSSASSEAYTGSMTVTVTTKTVANGNLTLKYTLIPTAGFKIVTAANSTIVFQSATKVYTRVESSTPMINSNIGVFSDTNAGQFVATVMTSVAPFLSASYSVLNSLNTYVSNSTGTSNSFGFDVADGTRNYTLSSITPTVHPNNGAVVFGTFKVLMKGADIRISLNPITDIVTFTGTNNDGSAIPSFSLTLPLVDDL